MVVCIYCNKPEACYDRLESRITWQKKVTEIIIVSIWLCNNPQCVLYFRPTLHKHKHWTYKKGYFYWRESHLSELNMEAYKKVFTNNNQ